MNASQKIAQYLTEARASEHALIRVLQSQIAMTPSGSYRSALETHLEETRRHADRVNRRLSALNASSSPVLALLGFWEDVVGQALALGKTPLDLMRGTSGEEKVLKNAKDTAATEALEVATYTAIARLARSVGDNDTAELAESILAEEERMLTRVLREISELTDAVARAELMDDSSYDIAKTGAADALREAGEATAEAAGKTVSVTKRSARQARKVPGVAQVEGEIRGAVADEADLAISGYESLTADEIAGKLAGLSQLELAKVDAYERRHQNRTTVLSRIVSLRGDEPWPGYDELTVDEIKSRLSEGDQDAIEQVRTYERSHKNRAGVLKATERELADI
jgi:ferritin-like metal-binding protein YciE